MAQYTRFEKQYIVDVVVPQVTRIAGIAGNRNHAAWAGLAATMHQYLAARGLAKRLYTGQTLYQYYHRKHSDTAHARGDNDTQTVPTPPGVRPIYDILPVQAGHAISTAGLAGQVALVISPGNLAAANASQEGNSIRGNNRGRGDNNRSLGGNLGQCSANGRGILGVNRGGGHLHVGNPSMGHSGRNAPPLNGNNPLRYEADLSSDDNDDGDDSGSPIRSGRESLAPGSQDIPRTSHKEEPQPRGQRRTYAEFAEDISEVLEDSENLDE